MNFGNDDAETERKIVEILARALKPRPVQELADEIRKSYDDTLTLLDRVGKLRQIRYYNFPGRVLDVELMTDPPNPTLSE